MTTNFGEKSSENYECNFCDYITSRKGQYDRHCMTAKHIKTTNGLQQTTTKSSALKEYICTICNNKYKHHSSLWKHSKTCIENNVDEKNEILEQNIDITDKELIVMLIKQNSELIKETTDFKTMMIEVIKNGTHNTINTNSHNKAFNLNFFLNETCKDAMNIMDFVDSIKLQLSDLENVGKLGYVEGISNIITSNLNALDITQRPIHCADKKRETIYIKDEDKWEKEDDQKKKIRKAIKRVACKNQRLIPKFKEAHPDCNKAASKFSDQYNKIIVESMGGSGDNDFEKEEKIIKNISKKVTINKNMSE